MLWGDFQNLQSWLEPAPTFLGVETGETLNTKGTHVGMNGDVVLDRSSTLLTSIFETRWGLWGPGFHF